MNYPSIHYQAYGAWHPDHYMGLLDDAWAVLGIKILIQETTEDTKMEEQRIAKLPPIKFIEEYPKLHGQKSAQLIHVRYLPKGEFIHPDFVEYDCRKKSGEMYQLPIVNGFTTEPMLQLVFLGNKIIPFCTMRRWEEKKSTYYQGMLDKEFRIAIGEN